MTDSKESLARFRAGHRAAEARQLELMRSEGPRPDQAAREAQDAFEATRDAFAGAPPDPIREAEVAIVRARWVKIQRHAQSTRRP